MIDGCIWQLGFVMLFPQIKLALQVLILKQIAKADNKREN